MIELTPQLLLYGYSQGIFPMAHEDGIYWYDPDPRAIIPLDHNFHVPRRLARTIRRGVFEVRFDYNFRAVVEACGKPAPGRESTWISPEIVEAYYRLHELGFAHSVEIWTEGELAGGLYGVALQGLFAGESMFSKRTDSSKISLVFLVERLRRKGFVLLDTQFMTEHLRMFGAVEISRLEYRARLVQALAVDARF